MKDESKEKKIQDLLQLYLEEDYIDDVPDNRRKLIESAIWDAEDYDNYDEVIETIEANKGLPFNDMILLLLSLYPGVEIVDDDDIDPDDDDYFDPNFI